MIGLMIEPLFQAGRYLPDAGGIQIRRQVAGDKSRKHIARQERKGRINTRLRIVVE